jgi:fructoselysine-6-P-deglycase FrlB-like protein
MPTIDAFEKEISMQLDFLKKFKPQKTLSISKQKKAIFCGTGDSYASSQLAEIFSQFRARSYDPLDLVKNKKFLERHDLYLISISGNTISNIQLAKLSKHATAITSNSRSKLANASKKVILLRFDNTGIQTSGSISFLSSALTCISLVAKYAVNDISTIYASAKKISKKIPLCGKIYVLGNLYTMPIAIFCVAKLYEVLGINAHYERIEQFSHMGLFSAQKGDTVILFEEKNSHNEKLLKHLRYCDLKAIRIDPPQINVQGKILFYIFVSELIVLHTAKRKKKKECYFIEAKKLRNASSYMIY